MRVKIPQAAIDDYLSGLSIGQVADKYGASPNGVWNKLKANGVVCRGSRNFTDGEELQIAHIYRAGHSARSIARVYGLSHHTCIVSALNRQGVEQRSPAARNRLYQINHNAFDVIDNEYKAYWWAFCYADSGVHKRSLSVALSAKDKAQVEKLKSFLQSEHPIRDTVEKLNGKEFKKAILYVTSKHLTDRLRELGIIKERPYFNRVVDNLPDHLVNHWIRGYFDGDGSAKKAQTVSFLGQKELLEFIRFHLSIGANTNKNLSIKKRKYANIYDLTIGGRIQALNAADYIYKDATIWMERKRKIVDTWR